MKRIGKIGFRASVAAVIFAVLVVMWAPSASPALGAGLPFGWGAGTNGQTGNGSNADSSSPVAVTTTGQLVGKTVVAIAGGSFHCLALTTDGLAYSWGLNANGQLGNASNISSPTPVAVTTTGALAGKSIIAIATGGTDYYGPNTLYTNSGAYSLALASNGTVFAWGYNFWGQLGNNSTTDSNVPVAIQTTGTPMAGETITAIAAGGEHSMALASDGTVFAWGLNAQGQLGNGTNNNSLVPVAVITSGTLYGKTIVAIAAGTFHSVALASDGSVYAWGYNNNGQLGNGSTTNSNVPVAVQTTGTPMAGKAITAIAAAIGGYHSMVLASDGTAYAWGLNGNGQLGNGSKNNSSVPVLVNIRTRIVAITCGGYHSLALSSNSTVYAWGDDSNGQLGNGNSGNPFDSATPTQIISGAIANEVVIAISGGEFNSLALAAPNSWQAVDVAVGSDGNPRLLWTSTAGVAIIWSVNPDIGAFTYGPAYGPYLPYRPTGIACGADGKTRVVWNDGSGNAALWEMDAGGNLLNFFLYGPYAGWKLQDVSVGSDGNTRLLWTSNSGAMTIWTVNDNTGTFTYGPVYGPYLPYRATGLACGADGKTRVVWNDGSGDAALWEMGADNTQQNYYIYGPYASYQVADVAVGSDGSTHLLWTFRNSTAIVWTVNDSNGNVTYGPAYGPYTGATASRLAGGATGPNQLLWQEQSGVMALWNVGTNNTLQNYNLYGPY